MNRRDFLKSLGMIMASAALPWTEGLEVVPETTGLWRPLTQAEIASLGDFSASFWYAELNKTPFLDTLLGRPIDGTTP